MNIARKKYFFPQTYFFEKLDKNTKNFNFLMNIDSKTPKIDFFTLEFVEILEFFFFLIFPLISPGLY
jgi:hypothetical protein